MVHWKRPARLSSPLTRVISRAGHPEPEEREKPVLFQKTREKITNAMDVKVAEPIRNIGMIAIAALIVALIGVILAVRR